MMRINNNAGRITPASSSPRKEVVFLQKAVQISTELFLQLISFHLYGRRDPGLEQEIHDGLDLKLEALARRELFSESRSAETPEAREKARQAYLDAIGLHKDWRW